MVNALFEDPVLYVDCLFERRALMFDIGNIRALPVKKLLRVTDLFVSHAHMDHFGDWDWLVRLMVGRDKNLRVYGPEGFIDRVRHKLGGYSWNLVDNYADNFTVTVYEVHSSKTGACAMFRCRNRFERENAQTIVYSDGVVLAEPGFRVRTAVMDHGIPCLAFCLEEECHVNIWKNRLREMDLPVGAWLRDLKQAVLQGRDDDFRVRVWWKDGQIIKEKFLTLGILKQNVLRIVPGQKIGYLVDTHYHDGNCTKAVALFRDCDLLFIETVFLDADAQLAAQRKHLTAYQAGTIARLAGAKRLIPIHYSPRYSHRAQEITREAQCAFSTPTYDNKCGRIIHATDQEP